MALTSSRLTEKTKSNKLLLRTKNKFNCYSALTGDRQQNPPSLYSYCMEDTLKLTQ